MKRISKITQIIMISLLLFIVMLFADIFILGYLSIRTNNDMAQPSMEAIAKQLEITTDSNGNLKCSLTKDGTYQIDKMSGFAFLINDAGDVVWSYKLPKDIPVHYTLKQVVKFTRYYLNDYPVFTHTIDEGIMVVGRPKHTSWKYQLIFEERTINRFMEILPVMLVANIVIILVVPFLLVRRDSRRREMERTTWIAGVSHDIRTPLSLVLGYADEIHNITEKETDNDKIDKAIGNSICERTQIIEEQAIRIRTLVSNLNTENKLTYGMGGWKKEMILLPAVIRDIMCEILNRDIDEKYDIGVNISEELEQLSVKGNEELIKRMLENLINNAMNNNSGGCKIDVNLTKQKFLFWQKYVLEISDNGCGVSREQLRRFKKVVKSDKLPEHGLGIRLVCQIAAFHHWQVRFLNNLEGGFSCRIYMQNR